MIPNFGPPDHVDCVHPAVGFVLLGLLAIVCALLVMLLVLDSIKDRDITTGVVALPFTALAIACLLGVRQATITWVQFDRAACEAEAAEENRRLEKERRKKNPPLCPCPETTEEMNEPNQCQ